MSRMMGHFGTHSLVEAPQRIRLAGVVLELPPPERYSTPWTEGG